MGYMRRCRTLITAGWSGRHGFGRLDWWATFSPSRGPACRIITLPSVAAAFFIRGPCRRSTRKASRIASSKKFWPNSEVVAASGCSRSISFSRFRVVMAWSKSCKARDALSWTRMGSASPRMMTNPWRSRATVASACAASLIPRRRLSCMVRDTDTLSMCRRSSSSSLRLASFHTAAWGLQIAARLCRMSKCRPETGPLICCRAASSSLHSSVEKLALR
mmetsp:Transcript_6346/g.18589  ORF Transcript_6346/g.18589 Transcript_6346/m.18589 type:complete len:219 (+) Transcript_6346:625-1281(+)